MWITVRSPKVGDAGIEHIAGLPRLVRLTLRGDIRHDSARLTDNGLRHLRKLGSLRVLSLSYTAVTPEAVERLKEVLPQCRVQLSASALAPARP